MKRTFTFVTSLLITVTMGAQSIIIQKTDGSVIKFSSSEVEYIDFSEEEQSGEQTGEQAAYTTCPDSRHPHVIDLGLPSGTKWACCNVGASTPEEYGNYYAWGETQPKSVYNWRTYQWGYYDDYNSEDHLVNIGSDIAGTSYDAATANWGAPWRMPSLTQIKELIENTTSTWTTQNGVWGRKFTGLNGGSIYLPPAGCRWEGELQDAGGWGWGEYWSSTYVEGVSYFDYGLYFSYMFANWYSNFYRFYGLTVRPVR